MNQNQNKRPSILITLWVIQGLAALVWLAVLPKNSENGLFLGYSASRLGLIGLMLLLTGGSSVLLQFKSSLYRSLTGRFTHYVYTLAAILAVFTPLSIVILQSLGVSTANIFSAYATRLTPIAFWVTCSSLELVVFLAIENKTFHFSQPEIKKLFRSTTISLLGLALVGAVIFVTKLGITRYNDGSWGTPTTPLLEWQLILAIIISLTMAALEKHWNWRKKDRYVFFAIYLATCLLWLSQPVNPGFFATPPRAPNFELYPFSDALIYAQYAQSALVGNGFLWPDVPTRPLYIAFITWLHLFAGQDYNRVILLQTLVLAAFPAVLYLLGKELSGRPLGLGLAVLTACRDLTANAAAPFALNYTYTKLLFSEIPAALLISIFCLLALRWMRNSKPAWYPFFAGGVLGLSTLIRLQSAVLLAAIIPISFFVVSDRKKWLHGSLLMMLGVALAMAPWLVRNFRATGGLVLDNPTSQSMVLARRWSGNNGNDLIPHLLGENDSNYSSRMTAIALQNLRQNPGRILNSAANHFFNNEIGNLLVFPLRDKLESPAELVWPTRAFWQTWTGQPSHGQIPFIAFYVVLLALGLAAVHQKNGIVGLLPLALSLIYNAWTALFLSSGDRFLVPVDWAIYLYLYLGLLTGCTLLFNGTRPFVTAIQPDPESRQPGPYQVSIKKLIFTGAIILLMGCMLPLTEFSFPKKYPHVDLPKVSQAPDSVVQISLHGRAIYPRWYNAGAGEPGSAKLGYGKQSYARLVFFLTGENNLLVIFPIAKAPGYFPNTADVMVTGTLQKGYLRAEKIVLQNDTQPIEYKP